MRTFEAWLNAPVRRDSSDPRLEVRRATPDDFPRIFALVDQVLGSNRGQAAYDWLYCRNPGGIARCWAVVERASGQLLSCLARFPWPVAYGDEPLHGEFGGDLVTLPEWQRRGLYRLCIEVRDSHEWMSDTVVLGAPNAKSRGAARKAGLGHTIIGPFPFVALPLNPADYLRDHSWPAAAALPVGAALGGVLSAWQRLALPSDPDVRIESMDRFEGDTAALGRESQATAAYWCPHSAEFLNWRYLANPSSSYIALAALVQERLRGYSVVRTEGSRATMMEFVAPPSADGVAAELLRSSIGAARDAGCNRMDFYATPGWCHWPLFRRAGFTGRRSHAYRTARCPGRPDVSAVENWQLMPGDSDVL